MRGIISSIQRNQLTRKVNLLVIRQLYGFAAEYPEAMLKRKEPEIFVSHIPVQETAILVLISKRPSYTALQLKP